ncbi:MAG: WD40 repeat domain-containing protein [Candidatus Helarchaeota archaeon]
MKKLIEKNANLQLSYGPPEIIWSVTISPNGKHVLCGSNDATIKIWELLTGKLVRTLKVHTMDVSSVAVSSDGAYIVSGSHDGTIKIWDTARRHNSPFDILEYYFEKKKKIKKK